MITLELSEKEAQVLLITSDVVRRKRLEQCKIALHWAKVSPADKEKWLAYRKAKVPLYLIAARRCRDLRKKLRNHLKPGEYPQSQIRLAENATCISARVHQDREEYNQLYQSCTGGFVDINILISQCAMNSNGSTQENGTISTTKPASASRNSFSSVR